MQFFEDMNGRKWPLSAVRKFVSIPKGESRISLCQPERYDVHLDDGLVVKAYAFEIDALLRSTRPVSPAAAGTYLLELWAPSYDKPEDWALTKMPVIGWRDDGWGSAEPVVPMADEKLPNEFAVQFPDGTVFPNLWGDMLKDADAYFEFRKKEHLEDRARKVTEQTQQDT